MRALQIRAFGEPGSVLEIMASPTVTAVFDPITGNIPLPNDLARQPPPPGTPPLPAAQRDLLNLFNAMKGQVGLIDGVLGVYRLHAGGIWSPLPWEKRRDEVVKVYRNLKTILPQRTLPLVDAMLTNLEFWDANLWLKDQLDRHRDEAQKLRSWALELGTAVTLCRGSPSTRLPSMRS